jgi:transcriptional regulator with XRE-family HTH domain
MYTCRPSEGACYASGVKSKGETDKAAAVETARGTLRALLRRGSVSLDEIGRRMGHTRGYMSRALRGLNPLTLDTIFEALEIAGIDPAEYFAEVAKALAPPMEARNSGPTQAQIEETVLRTLRRLGWARLDDDEKKSGTQQR